MSLAQQCHGSAFFDKELIASGREVFGHPFAVVGYYNIFIWIEMETVIVAKSKVVQGNLFFIHILFTNYSVISTKFYSCKVLLTHNNNFKSYQQNYDFMDFVF